MRRIILLTLVICCVHAIVHASLTDGLELMYSFTENFNDSSNNNRNGISYGVQLAEDRFGNQNKAGFFNGSSYIDTNWYPLSYNKLTLSAWIKPHAINWDNMIICSGRDTYDPYGGFQLNVYNDYRLIGGGDICNNPDLNRQAVTTPNSISLFNWQMCTMTYDGMTIKLYLNGKLVTEKNYAENHPFMVSADKVLIGMMGVGWNIYHFNGYIDEVRIYNRTLTDDEVFTLYQSDNSTLPVTLSSFTATYTASNTVSINWQTESESNMIGYYIYRSNSNDVSSSERVSSLLTAYNQPETQNYSFTDREIEYETTYYYWLQSCDLDGSQQYHGSICITTGNGQTIQNPVITINTRLKNAYPNPFNPSTSISFDLASPENVIIDIYNIKGQLVKRLVNKDYDKGNHSIIWNGRDNNGVNCGTGVYFYRMSAGKTVQTKK